MQSKIKIIFILNLAFWLSNSNLPRQERTDTVSPIFSKIQLDSVVVSASRQGFDVQDFIQFVQVDTSLYKAFQNLRFMSFNMKSDLKATFYQSNQVDHYSSNCRQLFDGTCRSMQVISETIPTNYYRRGKGKYFTTRLFEQLFYTKDTICNQLRTSALNIGHPKRKWWKNPTEEMKIIMFRTGTESDLPVIGKRMHIFDESMQTNYHYFLRSDTTDEQPCYIFEVKMKPAVRPRKTVVQHLVTHFRKSDFAVVKRSYHLRFWSGLIHFDISMNIRLKTFKALLYPSNIEFSGFWDVPTEKPEQSKFVIEINPT